MDTVLNKIREIFTGTEEENKADLSSTRDHKISKTQSFKEKKKGSSWLQRQFSRKMSHDYESIEHVTAVAAAAFAINSQEFSEIPQERRRTMPREISLTRSKSKVDGAKSPISLPPPASKTLSGSSKSKSDQGDNKELIDKISEPHQKVFTPAPPPLAKKRSNLGDQIQEEPRRPPTLKTSEPEPLRPPPPPPPPPRPLPSPSRKQSIRDTKADDWKIKQLRKIRDRYEKLTETINSWENRKKQKAKQKLDKHKQSKDKQKEEKALKKYEERVKYIKEIAWEARKEAEERREKEVRKVNEKAITIRTTGELPKTCLCF